MRENNQEFHIDSWLVTISGRLGTRRQAEQNYKYLKAFISQSIPPENFQLALINAVSMA